jgi:hypothetical protein
MLIGPPAVPVHRERAQGQEIRQGPLIRLGGENLFQEFLHPPFHSVTRGEETN